jgi:hypothetical protein
LVLTGALTATRNLIAPLVEKTYLVRNTTTGSQSVQIIGSSGLGVTIPNGIAAYVYCDGTNFYNALSGSVGNFTVNGNLGVTGTTSLTGATTLASTLAVTGTTTFTGVPSGPTAAPGTNTTQLATTAFTTAAITAATGSLGTMSTQNANAVAITGGTITGITDLTVADGGTGASTFTSNSVVLGNGTSALNGNMVAPSTSGNLLVSNGTTWTSTTLASSGVKLGLGITGEVWNNVTGSRAFGTTYTNSFSYPILISPTSNASGSSGLAIYVNGSEVYFNQAQWNGAGAYGGGTLIIPPGATYYVTASSSLRTWWELY